MKNDFEKATNALEVYWSLGETRTHKAVAKQLKARLNTINKWSQKYNWTSIINERLVEQQKANQEEALKACRRQRPQIAIGLNNAIVRFIRANPDIETWDQFDKAFKDYRLELGESTDSTHSQHNINGELKIIPGNMKGDLFERGKKMGEAMERRLESEREILEFEENSRTNTPALDAPARPD
jgi:uncharacterized protein YjcR